MRKRSFFYDFNLGVVAKKRQLHISMPVDSVYKATKVALKKMRARIFRPLDNSGSISAYRGWSLLSDGEVITIIISKDETEDGSYILIQSTSAYPKLWDLGVNNRNLNKFEQLIRELVNRP